MGAARATALTEQRVLLLHNRYRVAGGEERYVEQLQGLLQREAGFVATCLQESAPGAVGMARAGAGMLAGGLAPRAVGEMVRRERITVVHAHNVHPAFGWRALNAARRAGAATVLHLHNYRLFCAIGIAYRDGHDCVECAPRSTAHGFVHGCRGSRAEGVVYALGLAAWQRRLLANVDRAASPTRALADELGRLGVGLGDVSVLPTWLPPEAFATAPADGDGGYALYAGRVTEDKGVFVAIRAAAASGVRLLVAGEGPAAARARSLARELDAPVEFLGLLDRERLAAVRAGASCCVVPSLWQEVLPFAALEALAAGVPLVVSGRPGLVGLTDPDLVAAPGDHEALGRIMAWLAGDHDRRARAAAGALARAHEHHGEEAFLTGLAELYSGAVTARSGA